MTRLDSTATKIQTLMDALNPHKYPQTRQITSILFGVRTVAEAVDVPVQIRQELLDSVYADLKAFADIQIHKTQFSFVDTYIFEKIGLDFTDRIRSVDSRYADILCAAIR